MDDPREAPPGRIGRAAGRPEPPARAASCGRRRARAGRASRRAPWRTAALLALAGLACASGGPHPEAGQDAPNSPLLWRARAPGPAGGTLYLLGSVHMGTPAMGDLGPVVLDAYDRSEELVVEVDLSNLDPAETSLLMAHYGTLAEGRRLRDVVSAENHEMLVDYLEARGVSPGPFESLAPWLVATMVSVMEFEDAGLEGRLGVDQAFIDKAVGSKPIVALESFESQLAMLAGLDWEVQDLMLGDALRSSGEMELQSEQIVESWRTGDERGLEEALFKDLEETPALAPLYQVMFYDRNRRMTDLLIQLAGDGATRFVVLGAGHMVGSRGIPALLADAGFEVEQIGGR